MTERATNNLHEQAVKDLNGGSLFSFSFTQSKGTGFHYDAGE